MRIVCVSLCVLWCLACDDGGAVVGPPADGRLPGHDFVPQPAPEPAPMPVAEPEPQPEPVESPVGEDGVYLGEGTLLVRVSGDEPFSDGGRLMVELLDAAGAVIAEHEARLNLYPVAMDWERHAWWPVAEAPSRVRVRLMSADVEVRAFEVEPRLVPIADGACDPTGFANRCDAGTLCLAPALDQGGACVPVTALARWRGGLDPFITVDLRADASPSAAVPELTVRHVNGAEARLPQAAPVADGWRRVVRVPASFVPEVEVFVGPHRLAAALQVTERPEVILDAACDPARLMDVCEAGSACDAAGTCVAIHAPVITEAVAYQDGSLVGVWFAGDDLDRDVEQVIVGSAGQTWPEGWFRATPHQTRLHSHIEYDADGHFEGFYVFDRPDPVDELRLRVDLIDAEGQRSAPVTAAFGGERAQRAPGRSCDAFGLLSSCTDGTVCDLVDGTRTYRCVDPAPGCADPDAWSPIVGERVESDTLTGVDETRGSCMRSRGNLGEDRRLRLTAERAGLHRLVIESAEYPGVSALTVRRRCDQPGPASELACGAGDGTGPDGVLPSVEVELMAGETVFVLVEGTWIGGAPFTLRVERP